MLDPAPAAARREDPSRASRAEVATRTAESVAALGALARLTGKAASSPALHSTVAAFADFETTIESTHTMLQKINQGLATFDEAIEDLAQSSAPV